MNKKKLPQYWDDEVRQFHPLFDSIINEVLIELGLNDELEVVHHWTTKGFSGIIDFAICNRKSKKVLLPIEVKKSVNDLRAMGRRQCRGYLESLGSHRGSDYYLATNLEHVELFKDSPNRTLTMAQMLSLQNSYVGDLRTSDFIDFSNGLKTALKEVLHVVQGNDGSRYASNISGLLHALETSVDDPDSWHQAQCFYAYDYIRGALVDDALFTGVVGDWPSASSLVRQPGKLGEITSSLDFDLLFQKIPDGRFNNQEILQIAEGAFSAGKALDFGEDLSTVVNEIAYSVKGIPGVVDTTPSLADLLVSQVSQVIGSRLDSNIKILEPGCGSGNLIVALKRFYKDLRASQIVALEKEEIFREALSLRIGLRFKDSLRSGERPNLSIRTLESIRKDELQDIGLVVMNPPFIRGIDSVKEKKKLANLIEQNNLSNSRLTGEQLGYECGYLELLISLVPEQTVVAMIFPKNALLRPDSSDLREFLIKDFGLKRIVLYKDTNIFGSVQKSTVILIGVKGSRTETIDYYNYHIDLTEVDTWDNGEIFTKKESVQPAFSVVEIKISELLATSKVGWKSFLSESESQYEASLQSILECGSFETLDTSHKLFRGSIGNLGASEFLFNPRTPSRDSLESPPQKWRDIPGDWVLPAVKNSDSVPREITSDKGESAIHFPDEAPNKHILEKVIAFLQEANGVNILKKTTSGAQRKKSKSPEDLLEILKSSKPIRGPLVLIPRGQRALAQISFSSEPELLVSTNFFVAECKTRSEAIILSSWLLSVFGQLQFEHSGINQEGMRKLEKLQIEKCLIPSEHYFSEVELCELERVLNDSEPLSFRNIIAREIDIIWAKKLSQEGWQKLIDSVTKTLQQMCVERLNS